MVTVPHSGTRYVFNAFKRSGAVCYQYKYRGKIDKEAEYILRWGHFAPGYEGALNRAATEYKDNLFVVLRDPISTLATHYLDPEPLSIKKGRLQNAYNQLFAFDRKYSVKYFNLERDGLSGISEWSGLKLEEPPTRHSKGDYPLKEAIKAEDRRKVEELMGDTDLFPWFLEAAKPLWSLYSREGYDIWWDK